MSDPKQKCKRIQIDPWALYFENILRYILTHILKLYNFGKEFLIFLVVEIQFLNQPKKKKKHKWKRNEKVGTQKEWR